MLHELEAVRSGSGALLPRLVKKEMQFILRWILASAWLFAQGDGVRRERVSWCCDW